MDKQPIEACSTNEVYAVLASCPAGLTEAEAVERFAQHGPNRIADAPAKPLNKLRPTLST
ncbi:MAG: cation-transporting P-type ATPase [Caldilineaceae bacterium]